MARVPLPAAPKGPPWNCIEDFESASFGRSTDIDHRWLPMVPGTRLVYEGATVVDGKDIPHRVVTTVTDLTKMIGEVRTLVLWEEDYEVDQLVEAELAFFAQDEAGNVWLMGEYPEEYVEGELVATPAWISGLQDARPGILIPANPQPGTSSYSQGWGPAVEWYDRGQVSEGGLSDCVPAGCYEDVVAIDEFGLTEPNFFQVKYYAPGLGVVRVGWKGPDPTRKPWNWSRSCTSPPRKWPRFGPRPSNSRSGPMSSTRPFTEDPSRRAHQLRSGSSLTSNVDGSVPGTGASPGKRHPDQADGFTKHRAIDHPDYRPGRRRRLRSRR